MKGDDIMDQFGEATSLNLAPRTLQAIQAYQVAGGVASGALFRLMLKGGKVAASRMTTTGMRKMIQQRAADAGVFGVAGHSMRIGAAIRSRGGIPFGKPGAAEDIGNTFYRVKSPDTPAWERRSIIQDMLKRLCE